MSVSPTEGWLPEALKRGGQLDSISTLSAPLHILPFSVSSRLLLNWPNDPRQEIECVVEEVIAHSVAMSFKSFLHAHTTAVPCLRAWEQV